MAFLRVHDRTESRTSGRGRAKDTDQHDRVWKTVEVRDRISNDHLRQRDSPDKEEQELLHKLAGSSFGTGNAGNQDVEASEIARMVHRGKYLASVAKKGEKIFGEARGKV